MFGLEKSFLKKKIDTRDPVLYKLASAAEAAHSKRRRRQGKAALGRFSGECCLISEYGKGCIGGGFGSVDLCIF